MWFLFLIFTSFNQLTQRDMIKLTPKTKISAGYTMTVKSIVTDLIIAMEYIADDEENNIFVPTYRDIVERLDTKVCEQFAKRNLEIMLDDELSEDGKIDADFMNSYKTLRKLNMISAKDYAKCKKNIRIIRLLVII
jgi:hypothetical protein